MEIYLGTKPTYMILYIQVNSVRTNDDRFYQVSCTFILSEENLVVNFFGYRSSASGSENMGFQLQSSFLDNSFRFRLLNSSTNNEYTSSYIQALYFVW